MIVDGLDFKERKGHREETGRQFPYFVSCAKYLDKEGINRKETNRKTKQIVNDIAIVRNCFPAGYNEETVKQHQGQA